MTRCIAGSPARHRGNFLLRGQKKVTKEEALNRTPAPRARAAPCNSHSVSGQTRTAALSLLSLSPAPAVAPAGRLTRGCTPGSPEIPKTASLWRRAGLPVSTPIPSASARKPLGSISFTPTHVLDSAIERERGERPR